MQFIKTHLLSLLCGVAALAFIVVATMGMLSDSVRAELEKRVNEARRIDGLASNPRNQAMIDEERRRGELFQREYNETLEEAYRINAREPLIAGVFPRPANLSRPMEFVEEYKKAVRRLPAKLDAGTVPTPEEIESARTDIEIEARDKSNESEEIGADDPFAGSAGGGTYAAAAPMGAGGFNPYAGGGGMRPPMYGGPGGMRPPVYGGGGGPMMGAPGVSPAEQADPRNDPAMRAAIAKARDIRMYIDPDTFYVSSIITADRAPSEDQLWFAQMSLWIQEDVVSALAALNESAAATVGPTDAPVEKMPVKRLEQIRIEGYRLAEQSVPFPPSASLGGGTGGGAPATGTVARSFTRRTSDDEFDMLRFQVVLWVDQRELLRVIDALTRQNFYQVVDVDFEVPAATDAQRTAGGYLYGGVPVVRATLAIEGYFARAVSRKWMPPMIVTMLGMEGGAPVADGTGDGAPPPSPPARPSRDDDEP